MLINLLLRERRVSNEHWPESIPAVMSIINSTGTQRLGGNCARQVFLGFSATDPLNVLYDLELGLIDLPVTSAEIKQLSEELVEKFVLSRDMVEADYQKARKRRNDMYYKYFLTGKRRKKYGHDPRKQSDWIQHELDKLPVEMSIEDKYSEVERRLLEGNFDVGDYVLVAFVANRSKGKLVVKWRGPFRITDVINQRVYEVQHLIDKSKRFAHAVRLRFFANKWYEVTEEILEEVESESNFDGLFDVERLMDVRFNEESMQYEFLVHWRGFEDADDTWEPFNELFISIPDVVERFINRLEDKDVKMRLLELIRNTRLLTLAQETPSRHRKRRSKK